MKRKQQHQKRTLRAGKAALLAGALAVSLLAGCGASESEPVVTEDDLTPSSTVQDVIAQVADNGKTYPYVWYAEDPDRMVAEQRAGWAEDMEEMKEDPSITEQQSEQLQAEQEKMLEELREECERELQLNPVVSAQEAANIAGQTLEELYGMDLTKGTLFLRCYVVSEMADIPYATPGRMYWDIRFDTGSQTDSRAFGQIDATTGEWGLLTYIYGDEERQAWEATQPSVCLVRALDDPGGWDTERAEFAAISGLIERRAAEAISGSILVGGAQVDEVKLSTDESSGVPNGARRIYLTLTCDNGKIYGLSQFSDELFYPEYDSGYPLRAYDFCVRLETE